MYKIIGTDGREYGPIGAEEIRRWLAVSRVNAQTLVQAAGSSEWKPLGTFPELISETGNVPPAIAPPPQTIASRASNKIAAGICGILLGGFGVHKFILGYNAAGGIMLAISLCSIFLTCGLLWPAYVVVHIIGLIEGVIYLTKSDEEFVRIYVDGRKEWF
ncbi:MAG TPA: GYF domain-containing protein [Candidatus Paceibacterota bacterium]|nr:GYF domain-containing protein [Candidatus Paceibacterota bacterium]